jgi:hypothetical protein
MWNWFGGSWWTWLIWGGIAVVILLALSGAQQ